MAVEAVDVDVDVRSDRLGKPRLLVGIWMTEDQAAQVWSGDVALRLHPPTSAPEVHPGRVDMEMLLAYRGRWVQVGVWSRLGPDWPRNGEQTAMGPATQERPPYRSRLGRWHDRAARRQPSPHTIERHNRAGLSEHLGVEDVAPGQGQRTLDDLRAAYLARNSSA